MGDNERDRYQRATRTSIFPITRSPFAHTPHPVRLTMLLVTPSDSQA
ncbi:MULTISPECIES: hypothetical protein [Moorena]|nr:MULTISPECIES: hypothetical protein [Moorena]